MGLINNFKLAWNNLLHLGEWMNDAEQRRYKAYDTRYDYYGGDHRRQMAVRQGQADDNTSANFVGLVVDRSISMLLGGGVEFDLENEAAKEYLDEVWDANKKDILMHKAVQHASIAGTGYLKIIPDGVESKQTPGKMLPRLVALDPRQLTIETNREDIETVERYIILFMVVDEFGKERMRRETVERQYSEGDGAAFETTGWLITNEISNDQGRWVLMNVENWAYPFAPIIHWQNLPQPGDVYGASDVEDVIDLQDRWNFVASNINRIIRYHAHPKTIGTGFTLANMQKDTSADSFWTIANPEAKVGNLEMQSDLASSQQFALNLRQTIFDVSRTVDISSMNDKLGALTNFGLRVLFFDALAKLGTKQELFGEALQEINHRLLVLGGVTPDDGGEIVWDDPLPVNQVEQMQLLQFELNNNLVSKETISRELGRDYEQEKERMEGEQEQTDNIGAQILRAFERGGQPQQQERQAPFNNR